MKLFRSILPIFFFLLSLGAVGQLDAPRLAKDKEQKHFYELLSEYKKYDRIYGDFEIDSFWVSMGMLHPIKFSFDYSAQNMVVVFNYEQEQYIEKIIYDVLIGIFDGSGLKNSKSYKTVLLYQPSIGCYFLVIVPSRKSVAKKLKPADHWPIFVEFSGRYPNRIVIETIEDKCFDFKSRVVTCLQDLKF